MIQLIHWMCSLLTSTTQFLRSMSLILLLIASQAVIAQNAQAADIFNSVDISVQNLIARICQPLQFSEGSQAYRDCLLEQLEKSVTEPTSELASSTSSDTNAAANLATASPIQGLPSSISLSEQYEISQPVIADEAIAAEAKDPVLAVEESTEPSTAIPDNTSLVELANSANDDTTELSMPEQAEEEQSTSEKLQNTLSAQISALKETISTFIDQTAPPWLAEWLKKPVVLLLLPLALLALPLILIANRMDRKAATRKRVEMAEAKASFRLSQETSETPNRPNLDPANPKNNESSTQNTVPAKPRPQANQRESSENEQSTADFALKTPISETALATFETSTHGFEIWLSSLSPTERCKASSEFLILSMAYTDNRFDPELKKRVFNTRDPDPSVLIKRWAFKHDSWALGHAIRVLQTHTNHDQRMQFIDLLMALLVAENALTPIQNNYLRFLADAFGIGGNTLERHYLRAFGSPMPSLPRPDKLSWWEGTSDETRFRWDAQTVAQQPEKIRHRVLLGQPLYGELDPDLVQASYRRAASRCHRERVNQLGKYEVELLDTRKKQFDIARDALLETIA